MLVTWLWRLRAKHRQMKPQIVRSSLFFPKHFWRSTSSPLLVVRIRWTETSWNRVFIVAISYFDGFAHACVDNVFKFEPNSKYVVSEDTCHRINVVKLVTNDFFSKMHLPVTFLTGKWVGYDGPEQFKKNSTLHFIWTPSLGSGKYIQVKHCILVRECHMGFSSTCIESRKCHHKLKYAIQLDKRFPKGNRFFRREAYN